jgi:hypothetical protein
MMAEVLEAMRRIGRVLEVEAAVGGSVIVYFLRKICI